jgi:hypothetical protein
MRTLTQQLLPCFAVATLLAACSQAGAGLVPAGSQFGPAAATSDARHLVPIRFTFKIPHRPKHERGAQYISPSTTSLQVNVYNSTRTKKFASVTHVTTPGSNGCTAVVGGTFTCSFTLNAPIGDDRFDVFAIDALSANAKLSAIVNFAFTVKQSKLNQIKMTLGGIPASLEISIVGSSIMQTGSSVTGFQIGGIGRGAAQQLQVTTKDADGNTIVNPGAPTLAITNSAPTKLSVAPVSGAPGRYTLTPLVETNALPTPNPSTAVVLTVTATPVRTGTAPMAATVRVQNDAIAYGADDGTTGNVRVFAPWSTTPILTIPDSTFAADYIGFAIDPAGNVYVCNYEAGTLHVYPPGSVTASRSITGLAYPCYPSTMALDGSGNIFVPEDALDVKEFTPSGGNTPSRTMPNGYPTIAVDRTGNLYVANYNSTGVSVFTPGASTTPAFQFNAGMNYPFTLAFDAAGNLYVANYDGSNVTEYHPPFSAASIVAKTFGTTSGVDGAYGLDIDAAGNLYVANYYTPYAASEFAPASPLAAARNLAVGNYVGGVATDQLQNAYVAANTQGVVYVYPPGTSTTPIDQWAITEAWSVAVWP